MPVVSVIIPTYNRPVLLRQAIDSVLAQSYGDFEVIVVDDGSTDDTANVVAGIGDERVRYVYQAHGERSTARNRGLAAARGEYVAFLDDDDLYLPHKLATEVQFLQAHPQVTLVAGGTQIVDALGHVQTTITPWIDRPAPTLPNYVLMRSSFLMCSVLFRRAVLAQMDHWFDAELSIAEDTDFFIRLLLTGAEAAWLPEVVAQYRLIHTDRSLAMLVEYSRSFRKMLDTLFARPNLPPEVTALRLEAYLRFRLFEACRAYGCGLVKLGQRELLHALTILPTLANEDAHLLVEAVVRSAAAPLGLDDAPSYIAFVFAHLPPPLAHLAPLCADAIAACQEPASRARQIL